MASYGADRKWSDRFIPKIKQIVGPYLLEESSLEVDRKQAVDLVVLNARNLAIAVRVRRPQYESKYKNEFTIRSHRDSGATTEYEKITNGWGDWLFYGFSTPDEKDVLPWMLIDLHAVRGQLIRHRADIKMGQKRNGDGTYFTWFDVTSFRADPQILIASSEPIEPSPEVFEEFVFQ